MNMFTLVQQTTADYLEHQLGRQSFIANNKQEVKT